MKISIAQTALAFAICAGSCSVGDAGLFQRKRCRETHRQGWFSGHSQATTSSYGVYCPTAGYGYRPYIYGAHDREPLILPGETFLHPAETIVQPPEPLIHSN